MGICNKGSLVGHGVFLPCHGCFAFLPTKQGWTEGKNPRIVQAKIFAPVQNPD